MSRVYDRFADKYIDESEKDPFAPPERYTQLTRELLIENAARWFMKAYGTDDVKEFVDAAKDFEESEKAKK